MHLTFESGRRSSWVCYECGKRTANYRTKEIAGLTGKLAERIVCFKCSNRYRVYQLILAITAMVIGFGGIGLLVWINLQPARG